MSTRTRRKYSALTLKEAMKLISAEQLLPWIPAFLPHPPSETLQINLRNLAAFDMKTSVAAKVLLMDLLFAEIVPAHAKLRIWKEVTGVADYVIAPKRACLQRLLLCETEAKRAGFERGTAPCLAEMVALSE